MKLQVNKLQLSATVSTQVEAARSGMALLDRAHKSLANMQSSYKVSSGPLAYAAELKRLLCPPANLPRAADD